MSYYFSETYYVWPIYIVAENVTVNIAGTNGLVIYNRNQYIEIKSNNTTINGDDGNITIYRVNGYPGLVKNGDYYYDNETGYSTSSSNAYSNTTIQNIGINSVNSYLLSVIDASLSQNVSEEKLGNGWICQAYYGNGGTDNSVNYCSSNGNTTTNYWTDTNGTVYDTNTGDTYGGCIVGDYSNVNITNSYSTGSIGKKGGGICGKYTAGNVTSCYSTGAILLQGGGILGPLSSGNAYQCYSTGTTIGGSAGGIFGLSSIGNAYNCYSSGAIGTLAGGIFGAGAGGAAYNCYSIGTIESSTGGIFGSMGSNREYNCYSGNGTWSDTAAISAGMYKSDTTGLIWVDISTDGITPWKLAAFSIVNTYTDSQNVTYTVNSEYAFTVSSYSGTLTTITIPDQITIEGITYNVVSVNADVFKNNTILQTISIGNYVTSIGNNAFEGCGGLTSVAIPNSVTSIGNSAFYNCTNLASVVIGDFVTTISLSAFGYCTNLTSVVIGNLVTTIGNSAFEYCTSLTSVVIGNSVTAIDQYAFLNCTSLTSVAISDSLISIVDSAFLKCTSLVGIYVSADNTIFFTDSATNILYQIIPDSENQVTLVLCAPAYTNTNITIDTVTNTKNGTATVYSVIVISPNAFSDCISLNTIYISNSVTSIGNSAFSDCTSLAIAVIGDSITQINESTFSSCTSLATIVISNSITSISRAAFYNCQSLASVYFLGAKPNIYSNYLGTAFSSTPSSSTAYYIPTYSSSWSNTTIDGISFVRTIPTITNASINPIEVACESNQSTVLLYISDDNGITWTTNTINTTTGTGSFDISNIIEDGKTYIASTISNYYDETEEYSTTIAITSLSSNICFAKNTPVETDQGIFPIQKIIPGKHSIHGMPIRHITKTRSTDKNLICISKDALGYEIPNKTTILTKEHLVLYNDSMIPAKQLIGVDGVEKIAYDGEILYNVLMDTHDVIRVNNMIAETLHPQNKTAKIYRAIMGEKVDFELSPLFKYMQSTMVELNNMDYDDIVIHYGANQIIYMDLHKKTEENIEDSRIEYRLVYDNKAPELPMTVTFEIVPKKICTEDLPLCIGKITNVSKNISLQIKNRPRKRCIPRKIK
jgi:hypothetical protein